MSYIYEEVCSGTRGHRKAAQLSFGHGFLPYADLLRYLYAVYAPTS